MGELLQFPTSGAGREAVPDGEPEWTVPGVDADQPVPVPDAARRDDRRTRRAVNVSVATLARHDASEGEVRARLVAKGLEEPEVASELERLRSTGLVDDVAFAERLVAALRDRKGLGDGAIRTALRARLVPADVVDAVLTGSVEDRETVQHRLQALADDRARRLTSLAPEVAERRLTAYLLRKGYGGSDVRAAVRAALDGPGRR